MKTPALILRQTYLCIALLLFCALATHAQTPDPCQEGDCPPAALSIQLDAPLQGEPTPQRTEKFKTAYQQLQQAKSKAAQGPGWKNQYEANALGGRSCVRLNQLEAHLAYEYERNPDFKQFVNRQISNEEVFLESSFQASRRALNLLRRMESRCPGEIRQLNRNEAAPSTEELPGVFMKLGQVLGYFDEKGNLLKPLEAMPAVEPVSATPAEAPDLCQVELPSGFFAKLFRSKQVNYLKEKLNEIPLGFEQRTSITEITTELQAAQPRQELASQSLQDLEPRFTTLLPQPAELSNKLAVNEAALRKLEAFKPKNPKYKLKPQIDALLERQASLSEKTAELGDNTTRLKEQYDQLRRSFNGLQAELSQRIAAGEQMQKKREELEQRKAALAVELEQRPGAIKDRLDDMAREVESLCREADELAQQIEAEKERKEAALEKLNELAGAEEAISDQLGQLEEEAQTLAQSQRELQEEIRQLKQEVEEIKKEEATVAGLQEELASQPSEAALSASIADCEAYMKAQKDGLSMAEEARYEKEAAELAEIPTRLVGKLANLRLFLNKLKLGYDGIPISDKSLQKIEGLLEKASIMNSSAEILIDKQNRLEQQIEEYNQNLEEVAALYASMEANFAEMRKELSALSAERSSIQNKLNRGVADVDQAYSLVNDFLERYDAIQEKADCPEQEKMETLQEQRAEIERELQELETELNELARYEAQLEQETTEVEQEVREHTTLMTELQQEEAELQNEFGDELALKPVSVDEWKAADKVERDYWEATVIPDDELVRGYKGKYFEISLKDAEKNAKVLFRSGRYYMAPKEFRSNYGATIGSFVNEALLYLKESDERQVKLFIQGSADISGNDTFRGKLNPDYRYEEVTLLPLDADEEHFLNEPQALDIPPNSFTNQDLPNLRARYLKEILGAYTEKFEPLVLEGVVQETLGEEKRNAVIYLFFPEALLAMY